MDFFGPREVLIAVVALVLVAMVLDGIRRVKRNRYEKLQMSSRKLQKAAGDYWDEPETPPNAQFPSGGSRVVGIRDDADIQEVEESLRRSSGGIDFKFSRQPQQEQFDLDNSIFDRERAQLNEQNAREAEEQAEAETASSSEEKDGLHQDVLVMHLMANKGDRIQGQELLDAVLASGFLFGGRKFFDRHINDDGSGEVLFSLANLLNPGTFDLKTIAEMDTPGITLFMALDELTDPVAAFDTMVQAVDQLVAKLHLNVMDESRSSMTKQTIDHYRQRASSASVRREQGSE
ncbi:MAG: cell division protein ZipA [Porticoccaceae bacterium]|nr:cell division protein ZipA [Porticoccaceae bacterium]